MTSFSSSYFFEISNAWMVFSSVADCPLIDISTPQNLDTSCWARVLGTTCRSKLILFWHQLRTTSFSSTGVGLSRLMLTNAICASFSISFYSRISSVIERRCGDLFSGHEIVEKEFQCGRPTSLLSEVLSDWPPKCIVSFCIRFTCSPPQSDLS